MKIDSSEFVSVTTQIGFMGDIMFTSNLRSSQQIVCQTRFWLLMLFYRIQWIWFYNIMVNGLFKGLLRSVYDFD